MRTLRHKFNAQPTEVDGRKFGSKKEAAFYKKLCLLKQAGEIVLFLEQVPIRLAGGIVYRLDFLVFWNDGRCEPIEVKGFMTAVAKIKLAQAEEILGKITII